jgi:hypothetical protein
MVNGVVSSKTKGFCCVGCRRSFSYKCTLKVHQTKCSQLKSVVVASVAGHVRLPKGEQTGPEAVDYSLCGGNLFAREFMSKPRASVDTFEKFLVEYNRLVVSNPSMGKPVCKTTADKISAWVPIINGAEVTVPWGDPSATLDVLDDWENSCELRGLKVGTICSYYRKWAIICLWKVCNQESSVYVLDNIMERVSDLQNRTAVSYTRDNCVTLMDPSKMFNLRNRVVRALRDFQNNVIQPVVASTLTHLGQCDSHKLEVFGLKLRCWIELSMRFAESIPSRVQNTEFMVLPTSTGSANEVRCKLVYDGDRFKRVVVNDKVSKTHQPVELPVGRVTSRILLFYINHCRPPSSSDFVFCSKQGRRWVTCSRDVKNFLADELCIDPEGIDSNGRAVHAARHIVLASLSVQVRSNPNRTEILKGMAGLMRHGTSTAEKYYDVWRPMIEQKTASEVFEKTFGYQTGEAPVAVKPETLSPLSAELEAMEFIDPYLKPMKDGVFSSKKTTRDVGVQVNGDVEVGIVSKIPLCSSCQKPQVLCGPYSRKRDKQRFGRYYYNCKECNSPFKCATFMPITWSPHDVLRVSGRKSRNSADIEVFRADGCL